MGNDKLSWYHVAQMAGVLLMAALTGIASMSLYSVRESQKALEDMRGNLATALATVEANVRRLDRMEDKLDRLIERPINNRGASLAPRDDDALAAVADSADGA